MNKREEVTEQRAQQEMSKEQRGRKGQRKRKKRKHISLRAFILLAAAVLTGCFLLGAGRSTLRVISDVPTGSQPQAQQPEAGNAGKPGDGKPESSNPGSGADTNARGSSGGKSTASAEDWNLILVNPWNSIPEGYEVKRTQLQNGHSVDERCYPALQNMMDDCRAAGLNPLICSSFRTQEKQERLFNNQVNKLISRGYSAEDAKKEAGKAVAVPGTSEHQLGLAVDIVDVANQNLDESQEKTAVQKWLMENSWKYGFILRYPNDKSETTGIIYEPWHYRYVGETAAKEIYDQGVCLEEYLDQLRGGL